MKACSILLTFAALTAIHPGFAAVTYSGVQNIPIPFTFDGVYLNVTTGATAFGEPADFGTSPWINLDFGGVDISNGNALRPVVFGANMVVNLPFGMSIDSGSDFAAGFSASSNHLGSGSGQFPVSTPGYLGFAMNPGGGGENYGWIQVILNNDVSGGTIVDYAYESIPGVSITAGIPEPTAALTLALGLTVLGLRRRR